MKAGENKLGKGSFGFKLPSFKQSKKVEVPKSGPRIYKDFSTRKTWTFQEGPIQKLRDLYGGLEDKDIERAGAGNGDGKNLKGLKMPVFTDAFPPESTLVGAYFRDGKVNLHLPVFHSKMIEGQEEGAFWTFEDGVLNYVGNKWINVQPMGTPESPKIDPTTGVYIFKWAPNYGDATVRTSLGTAETVGHLAEGALDGWIASQAMGLNPGMFGQFTPKMKRGFVKTEADKKAEIDAAQAIKGGKRTKKRKMNKKKKTLRKNNKRKTLKGGKRRKSKNFKRTRK